MMIRSVIRYVESMRYKASFAERAVHAFIRTLEKSLGVEWLVDAEKTQFPLDETEQRYAPLIKSLKRASILHNLSRLERILPDEPPFFSWTAQFEHDSFAGGASFISDEQALIASLAECLERSLWRRQRDFFVHPINATEEALAKINHVSISRFAGFTPEQRKDNPRLSYDENSVFLWVQGKSLVSGKAVYLPAQTISGIVPHLLTTNREPIIRPAITTGLATHKTRDEAIRAGALEIIERDAFMIMWLNQLTLPRLDLSRFEDSPGLSLLLAQCRRYRLNVDVVTLLTDAPAHVTCAVVRDDSPDGVAITLGLGVSSAIEEAAAHAISEALRGRRSLRTHWLKRAKPIDVVPSKIEHHERAIYWLIPDRAERLTFLTAGPLQHIERGPALSADTHLKEIVNWCRKKDYELAAVDVGRSRANPTNLYVFNVVIPELQPLHIREKYQCLGGKRLKEIPLQFGYEPRAHPFSDEPHPFV